MVRVSAWLVVGALRSVGAWLTEATYAVALLFAGGLVLAVLLRWLLEA